MTFDWDRCQEVFFAALELPEADRRAFLDDVSDPAIRHEVERLIAAHFSGNELPTVAKLNSTFGELRTGSIVGAWRIEQPVGQGGSGRVYRASRADGQFQQEVAIKVIVWGTSSAAVLRRFAQERNILASCSHPHIARILDAGATQTGLPFLVMDYVDGEPITHYCKNNHADLRKRLRLFLDCLAAVTYLHSRGIIHRDLKPSNIFVGREGQVKLLDFGLAKILDVPQVGSDETTLHMLTPEYASPEQFAGQAATIASDVYSLGAVLYELLSGRKAHDLAGKTVFAAAESIRQASIPPASKMARTTWASQLGGDLDTVLAKALAVEAEERYQTVQDFAQDLDRYLNGEPVRARRTSWWHRSHLWLRRHWLTATLATVAVCAVVSAGLNWLFAQQEAKRLQEQRNSISQLLDSVLGDTLDQIEDLPGSTPARRSQVERARKIIASLPNERLTPELELALAKAYLKLGDVEGNPFEIGLGERDLARAHYAKAADILERLLQKAANAPEVHFALANAYSGLGDLNASPMAFLDPKQALVWYEKASNILPQTGIDADKLLAFRAELEERWGYPWRLVGDPITARNHYAEAIQLRRHLARMHPNDLDATRALISAEQRYADGQPAQESVEVYRRTIPPLEALLRRRPSSIKTRKALGRSKSVLGYHLLLLERRQEAEAQITPAVRLLEEVADSDSEVGNTSLEVELMRARHRLGLALAVQGRFSEANRIRTASDDRMRQVEARKPLQQPAITVGAVVDGRAECTSIRATAARGGVSALQPGGFLISDERADSLIYVSAEGQQSILASGGFLQAPMYSLMPSRGELLTVTRAGAVGKVRLVRTAFDSLAQRWNQTPVSCGGLLRDAASMIQESADSVIVIDQPAQNAYRARLVRIDITTGKQTLVAEGGLMAQAIKAAWMAPGVLSVTSMWGTEGGPSDVVAIDLRSGRQRYLSRFGLMDDPLAIARLSPNELLVGDANVDVAGWSALIAVNIPSGRQRRLRPEKEFRQIEEVIVRSADRAIVLDSGHDQWKPHLWEVSLSTKEKRLITKEGLMQFPKAVLLVP